MDETKEAVKETYKKIFWAKSVLRYFREYCNKTSIHGFRYFGERRTMFEKVWWLFIFMFCLGACLLSIITVYQKWDSSPVIVSFATKSVKIYEIPFPAITVCSESKIRSNMFNTREKIDEMRTRKQMSTKEKMILEYATTICPSYQIDNNLTKSLDNDQFYDIMEEVSPDFFPVNCYSLGIPKDCSEFFKPIITDEGLCFTSNLLDRSEIFSEDVVFYKDYHKMGQSSSWSVERGYDLEARISTYPQRALLAGARYAFRFELKTRQEEIDNICGESIEGYTVLLHAPQRIPRPSQEYYRVSLNKTVVAAVSPEMITTSSSVKDYNPKVRGCYFSNERKLRYFNTYTQHNCKFECITNFTLAMCNCTAFFMPRTNQTRICNKRDLNCEVEAEYFAQAKDLINKLNVPVENLTVDVNDWCDCMPLCSDIAYRVVISQSDWNWTEETFRHPKHKNDKDISEYHMSRFSVYFPLSDFIPSQRSELYGPTDFLANFGGLLGLFTGFSFLSMMEIIYFLTVRLIGNRKLYGNWAGNQNQAT